MITREEYLQAKEAVEYCGPEPTGDIASFIFDSEMSRAAEVVLEYESQNRKSLMINGKTI